MMNVAGVFVSCALVAISASNPAHDYLAELKKGDPADPAAWVQETLAKVPEGNSGLPRILVAGDSWADVVGIGGAKSFLGKVLQKHGCNAANPTCVAVPGSTSDFWANKYVLDALKVAVKFYDYVFFTLVGNDALESMPDCARNKTKSAEDCADELIGTALPNFYKIVDAIHESNPKIRVVAFGYDTMFGGFGCSLLTHAVFPQCFNGRDGPKAKSNRCFNEQFLRIQQGLEWVAGNRSFVDSPSIMGATQVAAGDTKASTDPGNRHIDMDAMGPAKYWPNYLGCFHPGILGADPGAMVVMEEFYKVYWSKHLTCNKSDSTTIVV